ncbi:MAG: hypothetical protein HOE30_25000 [Deltaproteobacteria bacterium]|nr:hypothetical protein [Deltaproteobacteria bacterium]
MDTVVYNRFADKRDSGPLILRQEDIVNRVYSSVDEAVDCELKRLYVEEGIVPTCKSGCFQCCGQHILMNIAEAQALTQYIQHEFSSDQIEDLRLRTHQWHKWDETRPVRPHATGENEQNSLYTHHYCPMLVEGECSAYPMRPLICRRHFVSSDPPAGRPFYDPESNEDDPVPLATIITVTNQFSPRIKDLIENAGLSFYGSIMLLPHWLAIEMNWEFAIAP